MHVSGTRTHEAQVGKLVCPSIPGLALVLDLAQGPGPVDAAIAPDPAAGATAGKSGSKHSYTLRNINRIYWFLWVIHNAETPYRLIRNTGELTLSVDCSLNPSCFGVMFVGSICSLITCSSHQFNVLSGSWF